MNYQFNGKPYAYDVGITTSSCHYGNYRYWFNCPKCGKRVGVLYCAGLYVCRHCIGANYGSRPKGMHRKTYDRLVSEHDRIADNLLGLELEWVSKLKR